MIVTLIRPKQPELLPGVDAEQDCAPPTAADAPLTPLSPDRDPLTVWRPRRTWLEHVLERLSLAIEGPIHKVIHAPQLNPLHYTGTITVLLLVIIGLTGVYLYFFYSYGFAASYRSVVNIESMFFNRVARAIHRYASGAALVTSLLHAYRLFFMGRFRGPRWLAWVSGVVMTGLLWLGGVTGYALVADQRAQLISSAFLNTLRTFTPWAATVANRFATAEETGLSWSLMALLFIAHLLLLVVIALFVWIHVLRLNRPKVVAGLFWIIGIGVILVAASAIKPAGLLPPVNPRQLPGVVTLDPLFLFFVPLALGRAAPWMWGALVAVTLLAIAIPWLIVRRQTPPRVVVDEARCTGCTKCALDCPYKALVMVPRTDGRRHKYVAQANPALCVSCGLCVGSCDVQAVTLGELRPELLELAVRQRLAFAQAKAPGKAVKVVFTCERHAAQGARPYLDVAAPDPHDPNQVIEVIPLPCVGALHPNLLTSTLAAGAAAVQVVGCPPDDCAQREGNYWIHSRLSRQRVPRLRRNYINAPISTAWVQPTAFAAALTAPTSPEGGVSPWSDVRADEPHLPGLTVFRKMTWRHYVPGFGLLALALALQVALGHLPYQAYGAAESHVQLAVPDVGYLLRAEKVQAPPIVAQRLQLSVDGQPLVSRDYSAAQLTGTATLFEELPVAPGPRHLRLALVNDEAARTVVLFERTVDFKPGAIFLLAPDVPRRNTER